MLRVARSGYDSLPFFVWGTVRVLLADGGEFTHSANE